MKYVLLLLALVTIHAHAADSESPIKATFGGQGRLRFEQSDRTDYLSQRSAFLIRMRPEIRLTKGSNLSLFFQPQFSKAFGNPVIIPTTTTANANQTTSGTTYDTSLAIHQATIEYQTCDSLRFTLGRQVLSYGNEVVLSGLDWDNVGRSFDALKARYTHHAGWVDAFYSRLFASNVTSTMAGSGDADLYGLYSNNDFGSGLSATDFYGLYRKNNSVGTNLELYVLGARIQSKVSFADYRFEATKEFGNQFTTEGEAYQVDLEVGANFETPLKYRLGFELFRSGYDYDQLYPLGHKYLGIADVLGRRNIQGGVFHASATPVSDLSVQFDLHYFLRSSNSAPVYKLNGSTALGSAGSASNTVGTEGDLILNYALSKEVTVTLGSGILLPGDYLKDNFGDTKPVFWYTQITAQL